MNTKNIHFVGIKGVGMTALALYCKERGFTVSGSDTEEIFQTDVILNKYDIPVLKFSKGNISGNIDLVIYSGAYDIQRNIETREAYDKKIRLISHGEALGQFLNQSYGISVAGTHGKTTSTALLATILTRANYDPSYVVGCAEIEGLKAPGHYGKGKYFIAEADEYQTALNKIKKSRFLWQSPKVALITNIDFDHPDVFKDISEVKHAFKQFINKLPRDGLLVYNGDDKNIRSIITGLSCKKISFGENKTNAYYLKEASFTDNKTKVSIKTPKHSLSFTLSIPGKHNAVNSLGVFALCSSLNLKDKDITAGLENYRGSKRRFEKIASKKGALYFDDYAHHPTEILKTLEGAKSSFPKRRLIVIFQPHTYSRTQALLKEFTKAFVNADVVIITEIFASAREDKKKFTISGKKLASLISKVKKEVYYAQNLKLVIQYLKEHVKIGDVVVTMGAGDIYKIHDYL